MRFKMRKLDELNLIIYDIYLILKSNTDLKKTHWLMASCFMDTVLSTVLHDEKGEVTIVVY